MARKEYIDSSSVRVPPQALDVEKTVLGSMLIDSTAMDTAMETLKEESFYATGHQLIFRCIVDMNNKNIPVDIITLANELKKHEWLESAGSEAYLSELVESVATSANISYHVKILEGKSILRKLISTAGEITTECFNADTEPREVLDSAEAKIFNITESHINQDFESVKELLPKVFEEIEKNNVSGGMAGVQTGFTKLDEMTTGLHGGDLVIIAGRPGMGKTSFALSVALNTAVHAKEKTATALFSLEMSKMQLTQRMLCAEARIEMQRLRSGRLRKDEHQKLSLNAGKLFEAPIYIDDTPGINVLEVRAKARRLKSRGELGLIIIDYLQLMTGVDKTENRQQEISTISRSLKGIAKELDVPVIALSQLSRAVEQRTGDHRPQLSDLRESGAIEQDADCVMFVFREYFYKKDDDTLKNISEIIVEKQRNGPTGSVKMSFIPEYAHFDNLDEIHSQEEF